MIGIGLGIDDVAARKPGTTIVIGPIPVNTVAPAITGTETEGQTLTVSNGTWTNSPTSYNYQWYRNGVAISGATASTRLLTSDDVGEILHAVVYANNADGTGTASSNFTGEIADSGGGGPGYTPSMDFSDQLNSGFVALLADW